MKMTWVMIIDLPAIQQTGHIIGFLSSLSLQSHEV